MWNGAKSTIGRLEQLTALSQRLLIRADHLPADLTLLGLVEDLLEAASAVLALSESAASIVTYPLTRTAFEAAQRIIVLATDDDYLRTGARAWLYHHRKDMRILRIDEGREAAEAWFASAVGRLRDIWRAYCPDAEVILSQENDRLRANEVKRGPDNFMCQDLARLVQERYPRALATAGISLAELESMNRSIYAFLSRESHARLRVDPLGYRISADGSVTIIQRKTDDAAKQESALRCLDSSISEAIGALSYLLERRERERTDQIRRAAVQASEESLPPGFDRDLGLHLASFEVGSAPIDFPSVPVQKVGVLPDGTVTWSAGARFGEDMFLASFDVPSARVLDLARALRIRPAVLRRTGALHKHTLPRAMRIDLQCRLGAVQRTTNQTFLPFVVERVSSANDEMV